MSKQQSTIVQKPKDKEIEISKGLAHRIDIANRAIETAEEKVKIAYDYAVNVDGFKPKEAFKILQQRLKYSRQWIGQFVPEEAKQKNKSRTESLKKFQARKKETRERQQYQQYKEKYDGSPATSVVKNNEGLVAIVIPSVDGRVKKFYIDVLAIREKAERDGLKINMDGSVGVWTP